MCVRNRQDVSHSFTAGRGNEIPPEVSTSRLVLQIPCCSSSCGGLLGFEIEFRHVMFPFPRRSDSVACFKLRGPRVVCSDMVYYVLSHWVGFSLRWSLGDAGDSGLGLAGVFARNPSRISFVCSPGLCGGAAAELFRTLPTRHGHSQRYTTEQFSTLKPWRVWRRGGCAFLIREMLPMLRGLLQQGATVLSCFFQSW